MMQPGGVLLADEFAGGQLSDSSESNEGDLDLAVLPSNRVVQLAAPARAEIINLPQLLRKNFE